VREGVRASPVAQPKRTATFHLPQNRHPKANNQQLARKMTIMFTVIHLQSKFGLQMRRSGHSAVSARVRALRLGPMTFSLRLLLASTGRQC
jgi:hypothetical protein